MIIICFVKFLYFVRGQKNGKENGGTNMFRLVTSNQIVAVIKRSWEKVTAKTLDVVTTGVLWQLEEETTK
jgi:hypothetical protein